MEMEGGAEAAQGEGEVRDESRCKISNDNGFSRYKDEIEDIENSLGDIKRQVEELLESNELLPEAERLDRR